MQIEALAIMKIIKHTTSTFPTPTTGFLVGMDVASRLEITNAFAFPTSETQSTQIENIGYHNNQNDLANASAALAAMGPSQNKNVSYQTEMIRKLREVNVDANNVGWYTGANLGNFVTLATIENQYHYQKDLNERTVALIHDVSRSAQGALSIRAFRLTPQFMSAYKDGQKFTTEALQKSNLRHTDIFQELPLQIHNSHLLTSFLHSLPSAAPPRQPISDSQPLTLSRLQKSHPNSSLPPSLSLPSLTLTLDPFLTRTSDLLLDSIEAHHTELNNYQYYQRSLAREQTRISAWQSKRKAENASRAASKQALLPEDEWQRLFKLPQEPDRLEMLVNARQVEQYARQVDGFVGASSGKMFAVRGGLGVGMGAATSGTAVGGSGED